MSSERFAVAAAAAAAAVVAVEAVVGATVLIVLFDDTLPSLVDETELEPKEVLDDTEDESLIRELIDFLDQKGTKLDLTLPRSLLRSLASAKAVPINNSTISITSTDVI